MKNHHLFKDSYLYSYLNTCCHFRDYNKTRKTTVKSLGNQKINRRNNNSNMKHCTNEKMGNQVAYDAYDL